VGAVRPRRGRMGGEEIPNGGETFKGQGVKEEPQPLIRFSLSRALIRPLKRRQGKLIPRRVPEWRGSLAQNQPGRGFLLAATAWTARTIP